jgi:murein DD-endopeptidase MepM/ murein hydrolase activator NlpD
MGDDYAVPVGTPVRAGFSGVVFESRFSQSLGHVVVIQNLSGRYVYAHLSRRGVAVGDRVMAGAVFGLSGTPDLLPGLTFITKSMVRACSMTR